MEKLLLGIDIGTSSCKVAIFKSDGEVVSQSSSHYPIYYPKPGWVEQNPEEWWMEVCKSIQKCLESKLLIDNEIVGIGIAGQGWSAIPVDKEGNCLHNTPIWLDTRATDIISNIASSITDEDIYNVSGNSFSPTYTTPKILWFKKHMPELFNRTYKFLQSNSFIGMKLTGKMSSDRSQNYGLHLYNPITYQYDLEMASRFGIPIDKLPEIYQCHEVIGTITEEAAAMTGLKVGIPVIAGGLDAACGALGAGVIQNYETQLQGGQAGGVSICLNEPKTHPKLIFSPHVIPNRWLLQGGTVGGGGALRWFKDEFGEHLSFDELTKRAEQIPEGSDGVVFLPYLAGERSPLWNPKVKALFYGLSFKETKSHAIRAVLEGVVFSVYHNLLIAKEAGVDIEKLDISAMGGAANSMLWIQIYSDVTGCRIKVPSSDTATTLGAALLAGVAVGVYNNFDDAVEQTVKINRQHFPDLNRREKYEESLALYLKLSTWLNKEMFI
ncbi:xylulokinase [Sporosarcina psychrophila]|uniref:xylulokinase n=1 Tax=Sporosarcina psychrophila TaxID=1476 RepID=UPI00078C49B6|nr:FGGY-family carbohydrate kinase [Sporosarcina psychrophila]AMQ07876.1 carbohydrate kinase [Sporosarcina psychrophila]